MPKKTVKKPKRAIKAEAAASYGLPKYPYSLTPSSLGKFFSKIPNKPRPEKIDAATLKAWEFRNSNDTSIIRVLKNIDFIDATGTPTKNYEKFMQPGTGPAILGIQLKKVYSTLFSTVSNPGKATSEELKSFFNTYGGGSERAVQLQIQTFKALAVHATFGASDPLEQEDDFDQGDDQNDGNAGKRFNTPPIRVDLHIHLPENKTKVDYDSILESIAKHIYGKNI